MKKRFISLTRLFLTSVTILVCSLCAVSCATLQQDVYTYSEDNNYYHRLVYHGIKTLVVPNAFMYHDRKLLGNIQAFNRNHLHRDIILEACNINQGFIKCIWKWIKILVRYYTKEFHEHRYLIGSFSVEMLWLLWHYRSVLRSRRKEKTTTLCWL